jgi:hypothetical protein
MDVCQSTMWRLGTILVLESQRQRSLHVALVIGEPKGGSWQTAVIAHVDDKLQSQTALALTSRGQLVDAFVPLNKRCATKAAAIARTFCAVPYPVNFGTIGNQRLKNIRTELALSDDWTLPVGATRAEGMRAEGQEGRGPPLQFDALVRIFKWLVKAEQKMPFSRHRGTTCVAFVVACHQAAGLFCELERLRDGMTGACPNIMQLHAHLHAQRKPPLPLVRPVWVPARLLNSKTKDVHQKALAENHALRGQGNRGLIAPPWDSRASNDGFDAAEALEADVGVLLQRAGVANFSITRALGQALLCDAKFLGPEQLLRRLQLDSDSWQRVASHRSSSSA